MHTTQQKFEETAIIIKQEEIADDIYSMWLHTEQIAAHAKDVYKRQVAQAAAGRMAQSTLMKRQA